MHREHTLYRCQGLVFHQVSISSRIDGYPKNTRLSIRMLMRNFQLVSQLVFLLEASRPYDGVPLRIHRRFFVEHT